MTFAWEDETLVSTLGQHVVWHLRDGARMLATAKQSNTTKRWGVWATTGELLGSSPDLPGAKSLAERKLGLNEENIMPADTSKLPTYNPENPAPTAESATEPEKPKRQRKPRADKGKPRGKKANGNGAGSAEATVLAFRAARAETEQQIHDLQARIDDAYEALGDTERRLCDAIDKALREVE